jgi:hypothetical protein
MVCGGCLRIGFPGASSLACGVQTGSPPGHGFLPSQRLPNLPRRSRKSSYWHSSRAAEASDLLQASSRLLPSPTALWHRSHSVNEDFRCPTQRPAQLLCPAQAGTRLPGRPAGRPYLATPAPRGVSQLSLRPSGLTAEGSAEAARRAGVHGETMCPFTMGYG